MGILRTELQWPSEHFNMQPERQWWYSKNIRHIVGPPLPVNCRLNSELKRYLIQTVYQNFLCCHQQGTLFHRPPPRHHPPQSPLVNFHWHVCLM